MALIEATTPEDVLSFDAPEGVDVRWLVRDPQEKPGTVALAELRRVRIPASAHAFIVGEQALPTAARRYLTTERGLDKDAISFTGYWRVGAASPAPKSHAASATEARS